MSRYALAAIALCVVLLATCGSPRAQQQQPGEPERAAGNAAIADQALRLSQLRQRYAEAAQSLTETELELALEQSRGGVNKLTPAALKRLKSAIEATRASVDLAAAATQRGKGNRDRVNAALDQLVTVDFSETPLADVAGQLAKQSGVNILLDRKSLDDEGIGADTPITLRLDGVTLRGVLSRMLKDLGLTYVVDEEWIEITTRTEADTRLRLCVYDVYDLLGLEAVSKGQTPGSYDSELLADMIHTVIAPTTWDQVGGPGSLFAISGTLVVVQVDEVHEQIHDLLTRLRTALLRRHRHATWLPKSE